MQLKSLLGKLGKGAIGKGATGALYAYEQWLRWAARGLQLIFALVVVGLYGNRVDNDRKAGHPQSAAWAYAVVVAGLSCITCVAFCIPNPFVRTHRLFAWDLVLFILWIAVFGSFASIFLGMGEDVKEFEGTRVSVMRAGVWVDLVNAVFWLLTGVYGFVRTFVARKVEDKVDKHLGSLENRVNGEIDEHLGAFGGAAAEKVGAKVGSKFGNFSRPDKAYMRPEMV